MRVFALLLFGCFVPLCGIPQSFVPVDAQSAVTFEIRNFGARVDGRFSGLNGTILFNQDHPEAMQIDVSVEAKTVDTGINMRDNHLRKKDYFSVAEYPVIRFLSTRVTSTKPGMGIVSGKLTIKKTTRDISFPFTWNVTNGTPRFQGEFQINRRHFDVGGGSISMADELKVILDVVTTK